MEEVNTKNRIYGYARVSSVGQNLDRQLDALSKYVAKENIVIDKATGANFERPGYQALKGALGLRTGDTLIITSLDRLGRNKEQIKQELIWMHDTGIRLKILDLPTSLIEVPAEQNWIVEMINNIILEVISSISEQERLTLRKRQREGIEAAKRRGKHMGRPRLQMPKKFPEVYEEWKAGKITAKAAMKQLEMPSTSFYRMARLHEENQKVR